MAHRGHRSEYTEERRLVRMLAFHDRERAEVLARDTIGLKYFEDGQVLLSARLDGSFQLDDAGPLDKKKVKRL